MKQSGTLSTLKVLQELCRNSSAFIKLFDAFSKFGKVRSASFV
jgi:hypothetical protein